MVERQVILGSSSTYELNKLNLTAKPVTNWLLSVWRPFLVFTCESRSVADGEVELSYTGDAREALIPGETSEKEKE